MPPIKAESKIEKKRISEDKEETVVEEMFWIKKRGGNFWNVRSQKRAGHEAFNETQGIQK